MCNLHISFHISLVRVKKNVFVAHMPETLDHVLSPLARLLVARGVQFSDLVERLKGHYVQAALHLVEDKPTDSRLSVMTGLQRREIARLRQFTPRDGRPNHLSRLVALWQTHPDYSRDGAALPLPRLGEAGSFEALAREVRKDVHPRTMLDTLKQAGTVRLEDTDQTVHLIATAYLPLGGSEEQMTYLADNVGDHLMAAAENVLSDSPAHFERAVHYSGLSDAQIAELAGVFAQAQMAVLQDINRLAADMKSDTSASGGNRFRRGAAISIQKGKIRHETASGMDRTGGFAVGLRRAT